MTRTLKGAAVLALCAPAMTGCGWFIPDHHNTSSHATSTVAPSTTSDSPSPSSPTESDSTSVSPATVADFPDNQTSGCRGPDDQLQTTDDNTRQVEGNKLATCDFVLSVENAVNQYTMDHPNATKFTVEALATSINAMRKLDCERKNGISYCVGRAPSQAKIYVRNSQG